MSQAPSLRLLGTGDTAQVPCFGCTCPACRRARTLVGFRREACSAELVTSAGRYLVDAGRPDLTQLFDGDPPQGILLTHYHVDHVQGLFHLRWGMGEKIPVFGPKDPQGCADLHKHPGLLRFEPGLKPFQSFDLGEVRVTPVPLRHSRPTLGYCLEGPGRRIAYLTDTHGLPPETEQFLRQWKPHGLLLDATFAPGQEAYNHNDVPQALEIIDRLQPARAWLTHVSHAVDAADMASSLALPPGVELARDLQVISL
ncbi:Phosphoribosyl 1,2-cyclic phosphodiesterase [compost metagenome]